MWNIGQAPRGQTHLCQGINSRLQPRKSVCSWGGESTLPPRVWGQHQSEGLINHKSVRIQRRRSQAVASYTFPRKNTILSSYKDVRAGAITSRPGGEMEVTNCSRIQARNQKVLTLESHKKTIRCIKFRGREIWVGGDDTSPLNLNCILLS